MQSDTIFLTEPIRICRAEARMALKGRVGMAIMAGFFFSVIVSVPSFLIFAFTQNPAFTDPQELLNLLENPTADLNNYMYIYRTMIPPLLVNLLFVALVTGPVALGRHIFYLRYRRRQVAETDLIFSGFSSFGRAFHANIQMFFRVAIPTLAVYLVGIIISVLLMQVVVVLGIFLIILTLLGTVACMICLYLRYGLVYFILADYPQIPVGDIFRWSAALMKGNKGKLFLLSLSFIGWYILAWLAASLVSWLIAAMTGALLGSSLTSVILTGLVEQAATGFSIGFIIMYNGIAFSAFYEKITGLAPQWQTGYPTGGYPMYPPQEGSAYGQPPQQPGAPQFGPPSGQQGVSPQQEGSAYGQPSQQPGVPQFGPPSEQQGVSPQQEQPADGLTYPPQQELPADAQTSPPQQEQPADGLTYPPQQEQSVDGLTGDDLPTQNNAQKEGEVRDEKGGDNEGSS